MLYDRELEKTLLGNLILYPNGTGVVQDDSIFYFEQHKVILREIKSIYGECKEVNLAVLASRLRDRGMDDPCYVSSLVDYVVSNGENNIQLLIDRLADLKKKRKLHIHFLAGQDIIEKKEFDKIPALIEAIKQEVQSGTPIESLTAHDVIRSFGDYIKSGGGVKTGINSFDGMTGGIAEGEVLIMQARPQVGKSIYIQNVLRNFVEQYPNDGAVMFSLEMSAPQVGERLIMIESGKGVREVGDEEKGVIADRHKNIFYVTSNLGLSGIYSAVVNLKFKVNLRLVCIDFLTRINSTDENEYNSLRKATKFIKDMAKELKIAVIVLSQVNRLEGGGGYTPLKLESGRGSGTIEEDADFILGAYRPELSPFLTDEKRTEVRDNLVIQMLKSRRTPLIPRIKCNFDKKNLRLEEITQLVERN